ncbi:MAG: tetratricopeptide repeat protein [bacterium]|nr:tetratricopeptide repeat protein [bacterium]
MRIRDRLGRAAAVALALSCTAWAGTAARRNREGTALYERGEYDRALEKFTEATADAPERPGLIYNIGNVHYRQSKYDDAARLFEGAAARGDAPLRQRAFYNAGNAKFRSWREGGDRGPLREAAEFYIRALEIAPDDVDAKYNLELALREAAEEERQREERPEQQEGDGEEGEREEEEPSPGGEEEGEREEQEEEEDRGEEEPLESPAGDPEERGLTEREAAELMRALEREERDPTDFIRAQIPPEPRRVEKDW